MGSDCSWVQVSFGHDENVLKLDSKRLTYNLVNILKGWMNFLVYELYLNKTII